jgi:hypothetical protein
MDFCVQFLLFNARGDLFFLAFEMSVMSNNEHKMLLPQKETHLA